MNNRERLSDEQTDVLARAAAETRLMTESARVVSGVASRRAGALLQLHRSGMSTRRIARELGISHTQVAQAIKRHQQRPPSSSKPAAE